jgi:hypothetical protein
MKYFNIIIVLLLLSATVHAQTIVNSEDILIDTHDMDEIGKELVIRKDETHTLAAGGYICNYGKGDKVYPISFTINSQGRPDGIVACKGYFEAYVQEGIVRGYKRFDPETGKLKEQGFMHGDTVINIDYNRHGQQLSEYRKLNGEELYSANCSYSGVTDSVIDCRVDDIARGVYLEYEAGVLRAKRITKGLPKDIARREEEFDGKGKRTEQKITYTSGAVRTIHADSSYELAEPTKDQFMKKVKVYNKAGKLIKTYDLNEAPPMIGN